MSQFSPSGGAGSTITASITGATTGTTDKLDIPTAGTTVTYTFPTNTKSFSVKLRNYAADVKVGYSAGVFAAGTYWTVPRGTNWSKTGLNLTAPLTIHVQATSDSQELEIEYSV